MKTGTRIILWELFSPNLRINTKQTATTYFQRIQSTWLYRIFLIQLTCANTDNRIKSLFSNCLCCLCWFITHRKVFLYLIRKDIKEFQRIQFYVKLIFVWLVLYPTHYAVWYLLVWIIYDPIENISDPLNLCLANLLSYLQSEDIFGLCILSKDMPCLILPKVIR